MSGSQTNKISFSFKPFAKMHYGWAILVMGILVVAAALGLARFGYGMILPAMQKNLALTHQQTGFIASANMFGYFISAPAAGLLAARFGPRLVIFLSLLWTGLTMLGTGLVHEASAASLMRFLTGIGSAGANIAIMGLASAWFATQRRGMATGFLVGGSGLAITFTGWLVPLMNGFFADTGWRYSWFLLGGVVLSLGLASLLILRNSPAEKKLMPIGSTEPATQGPPMATGAAGPAMASGRPALPSNKKTLGNSAPIKSIFGTPAPAISGSGSSAPGIAELLRIKGILPLAALYFCFGFSYIITATYLVTYLVSEIGIPQSTAGEIWSVVGFLSIGSGVLWGTLSDRWGRRNTIEAVFIIQSACYLLMAAHLAGPLLWLAPVLYGITAWSIPGLAASSCGDIAGAARAPAALGLVTFVFGFGQVLGPTAAGYIREYTASFGGAFLLAALLALAGAALCTTLKIPGATPSEKASDNNR